MSLDAQLNRLTAVLAKQLHTTPATLNDSFIRASDHHTADVSHIRRLVFQDEICSEDEKYLYWRYFSRNSGTSNLWVLKHQGIIIGAVGTDPIEISIKGQTVKGIRCMDAIIHPHYDGRGLGAWMNLKLQSMFDLVIAVGANEKSIGMLNKLFKPLPIRKYFKYPLNMKGYFLTRTNIPLLSTLIAGIPNIFYRLRLKYLLHKSTLPENYTLNKHCNIQTIIDELPLEKGSLIEINTIKTTQYFHWRYITNPRNNFITMTVKQEQKIVGYVIFCTKYKPAYHRLEGFIVEWNIYTDENKNALLKNLLVNAVKDMYYQGAEVVNIVLNDKTSEQCAQNSGFIWRNTDSRFFINAKPHLDSSLYDAEKWFFSMSDSDGL